MPEPGGDDDDALYAALGHPSRRRIVELLGAKGPLGFTEIRTALNLRTGTLYYHFEGLRGLIRQDSARRYLLTPLGTRAYQLLNSGQLEAPATAAPSSLLVNFVLPRPFVRYASERPLVMTGLIVVSLGTTAWLLSQTGLSPILLFFEASRQPFAVTVLLTVANWLGLVGLLFLVALVAYRRRGEVRGTLLTGACALLPLALLPLLLYLNDFLALRLPLRNLLVSRGVLALLQGWALAVLASGVSVAHGLRLDRAALVALIVAYVSLVLAFARLPTP